MFLAYVFTILYILFIIILECTLYTCKVENCMLGYTAGASNILCLLCLLFASFSLVLDLISCCFVQ